MQLWLDLCWIQVKVFDWHLLDWHWFLLLHFPIQWELKDYHLNDHRSKQQPFRHCHCWLWELEYWHFFLDPYPKVDLNSIHCISFFSIILAVLLLVLNLWSRNQTIIKFLGRLGLRLASSAWSSLLWICLESSINILE